MQRFKRFPVTMQPLPHETRLLVMVERDEVMRASLGLANANHPLSVVWCAGVEVSSSATRRFADDLALEVKTVPDDVEIAFRAHLQARRGRPTHRFGNHGDLRQLCSKGVTP